jgi:type VI secretion system protein ImpJ
MQRNHKIVWSEGMFLQPQHFQQHDRYLERIIDARASARAAYGWGFLQLEVDAGALALGKVQVVTARGIMPDGTPFHFPDEDPPLDPIEIGVDVKDELIVLALPVRRPGSVESSRADSVTTGDGSALARYAVTEADVSDSNAASEASALLELGALRLRLFRQRDVSDAYCTLGVVKVIERRADNQVVLDNAYVPPTLHVGSQVTLARYVRDLHGLLHLRGDALAARLSQPGRGGVAEIAEFLLLQTLNRYEPLFAHLAVLPLLHPERLFSICLSLAGDLATFSTVSRRPVSFPEYRHDDLQACFPPLIAEIRHALSMVLEQNAIAIELQDRKYGVRVATIADFELLKSASFVFAVNAQLPADTLRSRFPAQVKIGPAERIRDLVNLQLPGIPLVSLPIAPRQLPYHAGFNYFELERGGDLWKQLERSGGLAMHIAGEFPGLEIEFWAIRG